MDIDKTIIGQKFGRLTVLDDYIKVNKKTHWLCRCYCGNQKYVGRDALLYGSTKSCGCITQTHKLSDTRLYSIWANMKYRCDTPTCHAYKDYGGRGIKVCYEWHDDFQAFYDWSMANGYAKGLTIDRIDVDKGYQPDNCRWITKAENTAAANKLNVRRKADKGMYYGIAPDGEHFEFSNAAQFARDHNLSGSVVRAMANKEKYRNSTYKGWIFGFVSEIQKPTSI